MENIMGMDKIFEILESTINKSAIRNFKSFLERYQNIEKWFMCSDYCLKDKNKANDVITFVIFPYILDFNGWKNVINKLQRKDLKHTRKVSDEFCHFLKEGYCFSFSFILEEKNLFTNWKKREACESIIKQYIDMTDNWQITTPNKASEYKKMNRKLNHLYEQSKSKSFNFSLCGIVITVCFLAAYIRYLLTKLGKNIELFSWLPDRGHITNWNDEIYREFYHITAHCMMTTMLGQDYNKIYELFLKDIEKNIFYDATNRVADYICGTYADFNYLDGTVTRDKQCKIIEDVISDNDNIIGIIVREKEVAQICHYKKQ